MLKPASVLGADLDTGRKRGTLMSSGTADEKGMIYKIARYAIHDGPGIRTTVFLKGCPARCLWCCNPESQRREPELAKKVELCRTCPADALEWIGREITASDLLREVEPDRPFWRRSGGGVTLSGGEPLFQPRFVKRFLQLCREKHIHTALESSLFGDWKFLEELMDLVDFFQFDLKAMDPGEHLQLTGLDNRVILDNAARLLRSDKPLLARIPLVPGCNDGESNLRELGAFLERHRPGAHLEVLPYHRMGVGRYEELGRPYPLPDTLPPTEEEMERALGILKDYAIRVIN